MGALQPFHLALVAMVALLVFGPRKLPELARGLGDAVKEFKQSVHGLSEPEPAGPPPSASSPTATPLAAAESEPGAAAPLSARRT